MNFSAPINFWQHPPFLAMLSVCYCLSVQLSGSQEQPLGAGQLPEGLHGAMRNWRRRHTREGRMENGNLSPSWIQGTGHKHLLTPPRCRLAGGCSEALFALS